MNETELTDKQKRFCQEYILDWNATRAAIAAGYSKQTAYSIGPENLKKPEIQNYISEIQKDLEKQAGLSALAVLLEAKKILFSSMANFHTDWMTREEWENLTAEQRAAISEISTTTTKDEDGNERTVIKFKLFDKFKAAALINQMLGYNKPEQIQHSGKVEIPLIKWVD